MIGLVLVALIVLAPAVALLYLAWRMWRQRPRYIVVTPLEVARMIERLEDAEK